MKRYSTTEMHFITEMPFEAFPMAQQVKDLVLSPQRLRCCYGFHPWPGGVSTCHGCGPINK